MTILHSYIKLYHNEKLFLSLQTVIFVIIYSKDVEILSNQSLINNDDLRDNLRFLKCIVT